MDGLFRRMNGRSIATVVTLLLLAAALLTLVHWHQETPDQHCDICFARNLPSIHVPFAVWLSIPTRLEWWSLVEKPVSVQSAAFQSKTSRAPPRVSL
jgi:hypothetical protein